MALVIQLEPEDLIVIVVVRLVGTATAFGSRSLPASAGAEATETKKIGSRHPSET
jgi:hypothetical protein